VYTPPPRRPVPIEQIADDLAADGVWLGLAVAADLGTTAWALRACSTCVEGNPLGPDVESRIALKAAAYPAAMGVTYWLRRKGHGRFATGLRWGAIVAMGWAAANNATHALRRR